MRGSSKKKWAVLLTVSALCMGAAVPMSPVRADSVNDTTPQPECVSVQTTQRCSIWSAPATTEENRVKYVDAGYQIQVYPQVIESVLGDGKTFYRTVKGAYVLARCVTGAEGGAGEEIPAAPSDQTIEPLMPYGDVPVVEKQTDDGDRYMITEYWFNDGDDRWYGIENTFYVADEYGPVIKTDGYGITYRAYFDYDNKDGIGLGYGLDEMGEWNYEFWGEPSDEDRAFYAKFAHYSPDSMQELVADIVAEDPAIGNFLSEHGGQILICFNTVSGANMHAMFGPGVDYDETLAEKVYDRSYTWVRRIVQCQRGGEPVNCACIIVGTAPGAGINFKIIKDALTSAMNDLVWN